MQRAAEIDGEEIGHVHQCVDRAQADRGQPVGEPARARPVAQAADGAAQHPGASFRPIDPPARAGVEHRRNRRRRPGLQRADPSGGEVAGDAAHREAVAAIGGDGDLDHRVIEPGPGGVGGAHRRVLRQFDDAGMIVAEAHLARRQQHPRTGHAADLADLERDAGAGDEAAGRGEHRLHAGVRVRRAAYHGHDRRRRYPPGRRAAGQRSGAAPLPPHARCGTGPTRRRDR